MSIHLRVPLPRTDLKVFPLCLGTNTFGWTADQDASFHIMDEFWQNGGNFIDTADCYPHWAPGCSGGESETIIGRWMKSRGRNKLMVATKSGSLTEFKGRSREATCGAVDKSLERLGLDHIDLFYYHYDDESVAIEEQVQIAADLIDQGKIRYLGLSNYSPERMREFFQVAAGTSAQPLATQPHYNLLHRREAEKELLPIAAANQAAVFPYFALAAGVLTGKYTTSSDLVGKAREGMAAGYFTDDAQPVIQAIREVAQNRGLFYPAVALSWLRAKGVTAPIASVSQPEQLPALIQSANYDLNPRELQYLDEASLKFA